MYSFSFKPIINENSKILILGTMPGIKSLEMRQYYAHEQNAFWKILFLLFDEAYSNKYKIRLDLVLNNKIAVWDTLKQCQRPGSLDSDIKHAEPNDISSLIKDYHNIKTLAFNGKYAEKYYKKFNSPITGINYLSLPSTSPANAGYKFTDKLNAWSEIKQFL